jgi:hypothetical protein
MSDARTSKNDLAEAIRYYEEHASALSGNTVFFNHASVVATLTFLRELQARRAAETPAEPAPMLSQEQTVAAMAQFEDYFVRNYPGPETIIHNPKWHAPKLFRQALYAIKMAQLPVKTSGNEAARLVTSQREPPHCSTCECGMEKT